MKFTAGAVAIMVSAAATVAFAQSARQMATPTAADPAIRSGVMAAAKAPKVSTQTATASGQGNGASTPSLAATASAPVSHSLASVPPSH